MFAVVVGASVVMVVAVPLDVGDVRVVAAVRLVPLFAAITVE